MFDFWKVIAENLSEEEIKGLKQMFNNMDTDGSGTITCEELKAGLTKLGSKLNESEIRQLMDAVSSVQVEFREETICYSTDEIFKSMRNIMMHIFAPPGDFRLMLTRMGLLIIMNS